MAETPSKGKGKASSSAPTSLSTLDSWAFQIQRWAQHNLDRFLPPEQQADLLAKVQEFVFTNPKLAAFFGMNIALTGPALGSLVLVSLSITTFAFLSGIVLGLCAAVLFSLFCIGMAFALLFPVLFFTTMAACFLFLCGMGGYYALEWLSGRKDPDGGEATPLWSGRSSWDRIDSPTGSRVSGPIEIFRVEKAKGDIAGSSDERMSSKPPSATKDNTMSKQLNSSNTAKPPAEKENMASKPSSSSNTEASTYPKTPMQQRAQSVDHGVKATDPSPSVRKPSIAAGTDMKGKRAKGE